MNEFQRFLAETARVADRQIPYYVGWVQQAYELVGTDVGGPLSGKAEKTALIHLVGQSLVKPNSPGFGLDMCDLAGLKAYYDCSVEHLQDQRFQEPEQLLTGFQALPVSSPRRSAFCPVNCSYRWMMTSQ